VYDVAPAAERVFKNAPHSLFYCVYVCVCLTQEVATQWVACDDCDAWRALPPESVPPTGGSSWTCSKNTWPDTSRNSCAYPREWSDDEEEEEEECEMLLDTAEGVASSESESDLSDCDGV